ncbi:MAG: FHA domain-containing protein [Myxococcota bacterium]|nr:FHA domain-containing protein [Myxococcota bacterium]
MPVKLTVKHRSEEKSAAGAEHVLSDEVITLGREKGCQIQLEEKAVSRNHARISRDGALFFIEDLGSAYGTNINGKKLPKGEKRLLRNGDVIAIAQYDVTFDRVADLPASPEKTSYVARQAVKDVIRGLRSGEAPFLRYMNGPSEGQRIELTDAQELVIGRDATVADLVFNDDLVSRRHVKLRRDWSGTHIEDLGSRNGIKVNKKRTTRKTLRDKDEVQIGSTRLLFLDPNEVREEAAPLEELVSEGEEGFTVPPEEVKAPAPPPSPPPKKPEPAARKIPAPAAAPAPAPPPPAALEAAPPEPEPIPAEPPVEEPAPEEGLAEMPAPEPEEDPVAVATSDPRKRMIVLGMLGVFALMAVLLLVLVLVGA